MYVFKNTERNNSKASQYETKSLLYLIGLRTDRQKISILAIDCFNDITGLSDSGAKLWDVQSKGEANLTPQKIGKYLYTLYSNHSSVFVFHEYIFFMPPLKASYLNGDIGYYYKLDNFKAVEKKKIEIGLSNELTRLGIPVVKKTIDNFLSSVVFVEDREPSAMYVKSILEFNGKDKKSDSFYDEIFNEIRNQQVIKKLSCIEGLSISKPLDVLNFNRHIEKKEIHMLLVNRLVGVDLFSQKGFPFEFYAEAVSRGFDTEDLHDLSQDCQASISKAFFNKNSKKEFWKILEHIMNSIEKNPKISIVEIYNSISSVVIQKLTVLDRDGILFLSALIKDGLKNEN